MSAELFRQLSIIAEDKNLMTKLLRYARKLTATKADSSKMSEEEFFARVDEAKEEIRQFTLTMYDIICSNQAKEDLGHCLVQFIVQ